MQQIVALHCFHFDWQEERPAKKKRTAAADKKGDGDIAAPTPKPPRLKPGEQALLETPLPRNMQSLKKAFSALFTASTVFAMRGVPVTFDAVRNECARLCGGDFQFSHIR